MLQAAGMASKEVKFSVLQEREASVNRGMIIQESVGWQGPVAEPFMALV